MKQYSTTINFSRKQRQQAFRVDFIPRVSSTVDKILEELQKFANTYHILSNEMVQFIQTDPNAQQK